MATFAHEVRNPINNMVTGLQVLESLVDGDETQLDIINRMMNDCARLNHLMDSILSYAKPLEKKIRPLNLDLLIQNVIEKWDAKFKRNHIEMIYQCQKNLPMVAGDYAFPRTGVYQPGQQCNRSYEYPRMEARWQ